MSVVRFLVLAVVKLLSHFFYDTKVDWVDGKKARWNKVNVVVLLNHTSLIEPIYVSVLPWTFLWRLARVGMFPGADITLQRPFVGRLIKLLAADVVSISRKRDDTWDAFMARWSPESLLMIAPEGRMKRRDGMDKTGNPMTVRGGIVDLFAGIEEGSAIFAYSGGLHHVQAPGEFIRVFRTIAIRLEQIDIAEYKKALGTSSDSREFRKAMIEDLENRRDKYCPEEVINMLYPVIK